MPRPMLSGLLWDVWSEPVRSDLGSLCRDYPVWIGMSFLTFESSRAWMSSLKKSGLKLSDLKQFKLLHLTRDLLSALGGYPIRAGLSGLSLDARLRKSSLKLGCSVCALL